MKSTLILGASLAALVAATPAMAENVLRWSSQGDALTLDPHAQNEGPTIATNYMLFDTLVRRDPSMKLVPSLAESWEAGPDGWIMHLRKGVKFHDGADFTAEDVVFTFARAHAPTSDFKEQAEAVARVEVIDEYTVKLVTDGPNPILPNQLTSLFMMDKGWAEKHGVEKPQDFAGGEETYAVRHANGTGPYKLVSRAPDEKTVLEKNPDWWGWSAGYPGNIDKVEYRPISNASTRVAALLSGELDFVLDPPLQDLKRIEAAGGLGYKTVPQVRTIFFGMDQGAAELRSSDVKGKNPFADAKVREAFNLAIDKKAIQRVVMEGLSFPAGMITSPGVLGNTDKQDEVFAADMKKAKALMAEAGYPNGFTVQLDCPNNRYINDEAICQAAVSMLARIGVKVNLEAIPKAQHFPKIQKRETDFYMLGWGVPTLDSHYVFSYLLASDGSWNATGYSNAEVDKITKAITTETDIEKRTAMIDAAWSQVKADKPYIPLHHQVIAWAMGDGFDIPIAADDRLRIAYVVKK